VYVLEHLQLGCPLNHVVVFEDDILCREDFLMGSFFLICIDYVEF